jgi:hypothetical protein
MTDELDEPPPPILKRAVPRSPAEFVEELLRLYSFLDEALPLALERLQRADVSLATQSHFWNSFQELDEYLWPECSTLWFWINHFENARKVDEPPYDSPLMIRWSELNAAHTGSPAPILRRKHGTDDEYEPN